MKFIGKHYEGIHKVKPVNFKQLSQFKEILEDRECDVFSKISVIQRIGSPSLYATVWEINFLTNSNEIIKMAVKVQKDVDKTLQEIEINKFLNSYPEYFLQMYGSIYCENIIVMNASFSGYFIFMELAIADLAQLLTFTKVSENELSIIISQVFDSIYMMGKYQLFHGDLHIRNIFIVPRKDRSQRDYNTVRPVIGDFGETIGIDSITSHTSDIYRFCTSLLEFLNLPTFKGKYLKVKSSLENVIKYVNRLTVKLENDYDKFNEENRDEDGNIDLNLLDSYFDSVVGNTTNIIKKMI